MKSVFAFTLKISAVLRLCGFAGIFFLTSFAQTLAPGGPGKDAQWATAGKQGVGTSANLESKVWFTLAQGVLTEVYYPDVTIANVHLLQFVVVDPKTRKVETERDDAVHQIKVVRPDSLTFQQINTARSGAWTITKTYTTDPELSSVLIDVQFRSKNRNLNLYVYFDPSLGNSGLGDSAETTGGSIESFRPLSVSQKNPEFAVQLAFSSGISEKTNGYYRVSDGLEQLRQRGKITERYDAAPNGNVVQLAKIDNPSKFTTVLGFAKNVGTALAYSSLSLKKGFSECLDEYERGWADYVKSLPKVDPKFQAQFNMAAMQLKAHEDKTVRGANIASLSVPWGGGANANENTIGGYHLVWSRDLYQVATAFIALGDRDAAVRALNFLFKVQQRPDGGFPQNSFLDGKPYWGSLQLDEVAFPLILAYQLGANDRETYEKHVKKAADFIVKNGPATPQERWEEEAGYSPSTIAAEIAGLVCAAEIARKNGDEAAARIYLATADDWAANVEKWTVTKSGKHSKEPYYLRITQNGKPDAGEKVELNNGAGVFDEREIVDAGFLELVRLGIKAPDDPIIRNSLKVIDEAIRVETPHGDGFYRYNHDGYGELDDGRRWNFDGKYTGRGRLWALLSGERGQYELALADNGQRTTDGGKRTTDNEQSTNEIRNPKSEIRNPNVLARLDAMLGFANDGLMIPEQVWDRKETPENIDRQFVPELKIGEGTGSATPLAWSMAQFIRLAVNLKAGRNLDTPDVVYNRYAAGRKNSPATADLTDPAGFERGVLDPDCLARKPSNYRTCSYVSTFLPANSPAPLLRACRMGGFYLACRNTKEEMHACFGYRGEFKTLQIAGEFTDWKPVALPVKKNQAGVTAPCFNFPKNARVEYKLIVDGQWIADPLNPNKIDNGVGGENSVLTMPDYKPTSWDNAAGLTKSPIGVERIDSKIYGAREIRVYVPEGFEKTPLPVLYVQDGSDYQNRAAAVEIQKNLVKAKKIKPFIMVFLDPQDRMKEYWAADDYARYLATEVVPAIDAKYTTIKSREGRSIIGASLGGVTSVWAGLKYPGIFSQIGGQSASFWIDDERVVKELEKLDLEAAKFRFYFDDGTLEGVDDSRRVVELLKKKGFAVTYVEAEAGHNWTAWRDRLANAFVAFMN